MTNRCPRLLPAILIVGVILGATTSASAQTNSYNSGEYAPMLPTEASFELFFGELTSSDSTADGVGAWSLNVGIAQLLPIVPDTARFLIGGRFGLGSFDSPDTSNVSVQLLLDFGVELVFTPPPGPVFSLLIRGSIGFVGLYREQSSTDTSAWFRFGAVGIEIEPRVYLTRLLFVYVGLHAFSLPGIDAEASSGGTTVTVDDIDDAIRVGAKLGIGFPF